MTEEQIKSIRDASACFMQMSLNAYTKAEYIRARQGGTIECIEAEETGALFKQHQEALTAIANDPVNQPTG